MFHLVPRMACLDGRRMLFLAAVLSLLIGVVGVLLSRLVVGLAGMTLCSVASCGYLVTVMGDFVRRRDSSS
jgi:ABC-type Mn2+/Zn2+ transport system permease subunit